MASTRKADRVLTLHPNKKKKGVNVARDKYDDMRRALLKVIPRRKDGVAFQDLTDLVKPQLDPRVFDPESSISWYVVTVKQDLEARKLIEQVPDKRTQHLRRASGARR